MVNNKIYVIGGRIGAAFITRASNTDIVEEYDPGTDQWGALKAPMPTRAARRRGAPTRAGSTSPAARRAPRDVGARSAQSRLTIRPPNTWSSLPSMEFPRHGLAGDVIGNRLHLVSGDVGSPAAARRRISTPKYTRRWSIPQKVTGSRRRRPGPRVRAREYLRGGRLRSPRYFFTARRPSRRRHLVTRHQRNDQ